MIAQSSMPLMPDGAPAMSIHSSVHVVREFRQVAWDDALAARVAEMAKTWLAEDLGCECDWTTVATVGPAAVASLDVVARKSGVIAGLAAAAVVASVADEQLQWQSLVTDGAAVQAGDAVATLAGPTRSVLTAERTILNLLGRMSGVATATHRLVDAVAGTNCRIYDTRKTVPGWRLLDKLAVRLGGGWNHRLGLYDAILIKDNHLAAAGADGLTAGEAVVRARRFVAEAFPPERAGRVIVEVEVDSLDQLKAVLPCGPDVVLLDNMNAEQLAQAVSLRNAVAPEVVLEASGGIRPETVRAVAESGVERVSTGWPTHHAPWLDVALDWPRR
jgi:nicotinate-nucleotide pyrophosphorylase (carboxylating)